MELLCKEIGVAMAYAKRLVWPWLMQRDWCGHGLCKEIGVAMAYAKRLVWPWLSMRAFVSLSCSLWNFICIWLSWRSRSGETNQRAGAERLFRKLFKLFLRFTQPPVQ